MSTSRNKFKEESEKGVSTRRSAKSTDVKDTTKHSTPSTPLPEETTKSVFPLIYQCKNCGLILSDLNTTVKTIQLEEIVLLFPTNFEKLILNTKEVLLAAEGEFDQFCAYNIVFCSKCQQAIGKHYLSTTEKVNIAKDFLVVPETNLSIYDMRTAKMTTPSGKKERSIDSSTSKRVVVTSNRRQSKENKEQVLPPHELSFNTSEKSHPNQSPAGWNFQEERKYDEGKASLTKSLCEDVDEKEIKRVQQVDNSFNEMKSILAGFAQLLEQFDIRLSSNEKTMGMINATLNGIYKELKIEETIDLTD